MIKSVSFIFDTSKNIQQKYYEDFAEKVVSCNGKQITTDIKTWVKSLLVKCNYNIHKTNRVGIDEGRCTSPKN